VKKAIIYFILGSFYTLINFVHHLIKEFIFVNLRYRTQFLNEQ